MSKKKSVKKEVSVDGAEVDAPTAEVSEEAPAKHFSLAEAMLSIKGADPQMDDDDTPTDAILEIIESISGAKKVGDILHVRRKIRYLLFRIREGGRVADHYDNGLKSYIEKQFKPSMSWSNFTYEWDVAPNNPLMVIHKTITNYEWLDMGGWFSGDDKKAPPAFTKQA